MSESQGLTHLATPAWDEWMDDLRVYVLFNSISVISGQYLNDNERLVQWNSVYG